MLIKKYLKTLSRLYKNYINFSSSSVVFLRSNVVENLLIFAKNMKMLPILVGFLFDLIKTMLIFAKTLMYANQPITILNTMIMITLKEIKTTFVVKKKITLNQLMIVQTLKTMCM